MAEAPDMVRCLMCEKWLDFSIDKEWCNSCNICLNCGCICSECDTEITKPKKPAKKRKTK